MKTTFAVGVANTGLRALTVLSKFLLVVAMARLLPPGEVGVYGLVASALAFSTQLIGLELHLISARELVVSPPARRLLLMRDHAVFLGLAFAVGIPLVLGFFAIGSLPWRLLPAFLALLFLEQCGQDAYRFLISLGRPLRATAILFLRSGAWAIVAMALLVADPRRGLGTVLLLWVAAAVLSLALGVRWLIGPYSALHAIRKTSVDWRWIARGARAALPLFVSTLAFRGIFTLDRYILERGAGHDAVGVYTFFTGVTNALQMALDASVFVIWYPRLLAARQSGGLLQSVRGFARQTTGVLTGLAFLAGLAIMPVLWFVGKAAYSDGLATFWVLLVAAVVTGLGMVPHYVLYALGRDRAISGANLLGLTLVLVLDMILVRPFGHLGVAVGQLVGMTALSVAKGVAARRPVHRERVTA